MAEGRKGSCAIAHGHPHPALRTKAHPVRLGGLVMDALGPPLRLLGHPLRELGPSCQKVYHGADPPVWIVVANVLLFLFSHRVSSLRKKLTAQRSLRMNCLKPKVKPGFVVNASFGQC